MMREVPSHVDSDLLERDILSYWDIEKIFEKSLEQHKNKKQFTFYDGPPYATGKPHYGHVLQSAIKDTVLRYKTMQGYYVPRRVGWDTHGLPIENIVEKELGIKSKRDIEADIEGFNEKCKETVYRYMDMFRDTLKRIGRWADYGNEYSTLDRDYMESEWWVFKNLWDQELIYKAFRSTPYCIRCATPLSNFEVSSSYKDTRDMSVYVALHSKEDTPRILIWTTTPWTLPANVAVAYNPEIAYVVAKKEDQEYILAKDRVKSVLGDDGEIIRDISSDELASFTYQPLFESALNDEEKSKSFRLVASDHVSAEDGTGLVHMAPAFGEDDFNVAKKENLPILRNIDALGVYQSDVPIWAGRNIFDAQKDIIKDLDTRGVLFKRELITHSYPFCWRCDTPLIYMAIDTWFLKVSALKQKMIDLNQNIRWIPEHVKHGRFEKGIESAPDWAISRNRFWSVPMPVWECSECEERVCIGSVKELQQKSGATEEQVQDIHRPYVDDIVWEHKGCPGLPDPLHLPLRKGERTTRIPLLTKEGVGEIISGIFRRIPEVLDVWFDSGSMPYSQAHYPFENKQKVESGYPADFIVESIEMTRAWFYVLHVLATGLTQNDIGLGKDKPAFLNAIASGLIFAEDGEKLSKKLKNYPEIEPVLEQYGADVLRFYLLSSTALGEPYRFSEKDMRQVQRNVYLTLWNVYSMFTRYAKVHSFSPPARGGAGGGGSWANSKSANQLDIWILARTEQLIAEVTRHTDAYRIDSAAREFVTYIDDLSNWYVRRSRTRLQHPAHEQEKHEVFGTLHSVLIQVAKVLAPFMPFVAEEMYRNLTGEESVHLVPWPKAEQFDAVIIDRTKAVRETISQALAARAVAKIKVRQPLQTLELSSSAEEFFPEDLEMIKEEVNVKEIRLTSGDALQLDTAITPELKQEGIARDIIRYVQGLRKQAGYALDDKISVALHTDNKEILDAIATHKETVISALQATNIVDVLEDADAIEEVKLEGELVTIAVKKIKLPQ
ncbi:MAG TPA: class I tRNA ligase family protein [Candidatus Andersenbacteria bacterium]|nr:class I tRNA ligase family protein [Candidatus Andersenbacteria bacterium]